MQTVGFRQGQGTGDLFLYTNIYNFKGVRILSHRQHLKSCLTITRKTVGKMKEKSWKPNCSAVWQTHVHSKSCAIISDSWLPRQRPLSSGPKLHRTFQLLLTVQSVWTLWETFIYLSIGTESCKLRLGCMYAPLAPCKEWKPSPSVQCSNFMFSVMW